MIRILPVLLSALWTLGVLDATAYARPTIDYPDRVSKHWATRRPKVGLPESVKRFNRAFRDRRYGECLRIARDAVEDHPHSPASKIMLEKARFAAKMAR